ncbi:Proline--tRNA ligase [Candidatus Jidaibacter acanthamoeba]|uniref:Proline--tRNA ligase n=2 Tax=Candidatus Jidaibacter acanthamoebae TaxID=86105 RepID=A0A0C1QP75_9RICK|nr:Proline--tRNA ligase [Candidatus Jidaibacter acanthamoeba]
MMRLSKYFLPILKETPIEASVVSHQLMLRSGMIRQLTSGIYNWLPLGLKVLKNIENIIREEMDASGAQEVLMPCIQPAELWKKSGRFGGTDDLSEEMLKMKDRHGNQLLFAPTAEEVISELFNNNTQSYRDLPKNLYQISWKFRDEIRPRFGLMRGREFLMKDAYSFDIDKEAALKTYKTMMQTYINIFNRLGLKAIPVTADSGSIGGDYSHEFHILSETGESTIYYDRELEKHLNSNFDLELFSKYYAADKDKHNPKECKVSEENLLVKKGIEVGHVFYLGQKYSKSLEVTLQGKDGQLIYPHMGCYGIGVSRLIAAIIEASHDEKGIIWPASVAPFSLGLINLKAEDEKCNAACMQVINTIPNVLYDDTSDSAGAKFAKMDLIGLPWQLVVGPRGISTGMVELKNRKTGEKEELSLETAINKLRQC